MDREDLISRLNWFYTLEINQVDLYMTQSREIDDPHLQRALKKFAETEQGHVENIREMIEQLGQTPTLVGEVLGDITGRIAGKLSSFPSHARTLRFDVALEKKAIADYRKLMDAVEEPAVRDLLWNNLIDEELHTSWMQRKIALYRREESKQS